jgi:acetyl esterase/lipase
MLTRHFSAAIFVLLWASMAAGQSISSQPASKPATQQVANGISFVPLWPRGSVPHAQGQRDADTPAVQVFGAAPDKATGAAMVVCPGGGYGGLAQHEGPKVGQWFAENGITAFVLRYRLGPKYHYPAEIEDAQRAIRFVRADAAKWKIDPKRIGIIGFSAGGHLASSAATHYTAGDPGSEDPIDRVSSRPDLQILIYPVINLGGPDTHIGSRNNLLGKDADPKLIELFSNQKQVTSDTPPGFVVHSITDKVVPVSNADNYVQAMKDAGVACEYIRLETGPHGFGLTQLWTPQCLEWLRKNKF